jgi:hypothetical protein
MCETFGNCRGFVEQPRESARNVMAGGLGDRQQLALGVVLHESSFLLQPSVYRAIG